MHSFFGIDASFALIFGSHTTVVGSTGLSKTINLPLCNQFGCLLKEIFPAGMLPAGYTY